MRAPWFLPEPGDILWCWFPEDIVGAPGPKPRPALAITVSQMENGAGVQVVYGTSQKLHKLLAGEFAIRKVDHPAAYLLAGLSADTKFDFNRIIELPWNEHFFSVPPSPRFGQHPKLGALHPSMLRATQAALRAIRSQH